MGHSTSSGRSTGVTPGGNSSNDRLARAASVETLFSTYETNFSRDSISDQMVAQQAESELARRLEGTEFASRPDIPPLYNPENATDEQRESWIKRASNRQLLSAFTSAAGRLTRDGIPSSMTRAQYRQAKAEIERRLRS